MQPRAAAEAATLEKAGRLTAFEEFSAGTARKYIMISGKGGVGKTSLAASLAVKLAAAGHQTLVVSTDPAHSLSDSLDQVHARFCPTTMYATPRGLDAWQVSSVGVPLLAALLH